MVYIHVVERKDWQMPVSSCCRKIDVCIGVHQNVGEAIQAIRQQHSKDPTISYFYVVDERKKLLGTVHPKDLLINELDTPISKVINTKIRMISESQKKGEALLLMQKYHLLALPVVRGGIFLGVVDIRDFFEETLEVSSAKRKLYSVMTMGFALEEKQLPTWKKYFTRAPWMLCNITGGIICAIIADIYEIVLLKAIVLAMFTPLVLSLSESIAMQSMTQCLYEMSKNSSFWKGASVYIAHESKLFASIAISCGIFIGLISLFWGDGIGPAVVIGASIMISVITSAILGIFIPLVLQGIRLDPRVASGPIALMVVDTITTTIYLSLAFWWLL